MDDQNFDIVELRKQIGEPVILVDRECSFSSVICAIGRDDGQWLTSLGWGTTRRNVPLSCYPLKGLLAIRLPNAFAEELKSGTVLKLFSSELNIRGELVWPATSNDVTSEATPSTTKSRPLPSSASRTAKSPIVAPKDQSAKQKPLGLQNVEAAPVPQDQKSPPPKIIPITPPVSASSPENPTTPPSRNGRSVAAIAGLSVIVVTAGITGFSLLKDSDVTTAPNVQTATKASVDVNPVKTETEAPIVTAPIETTPIEPEKTPETPETPETTKTPEASKAEVIEPSKARTTPPVAAPRAVPRDVAMTSEAVLELQKNLGELGFFSARLSGVIDVHTRRAVIEYRRAADLPAEKHVSSEIVEIINLEVKTRQAEAKAALEAQKKQEAEAAAAIAAAEVRRIEQARLAAEQLEKERLAAEQKARAEAAKAAETAAAAKTVIVEAVLQSRADVLYPQGTSRDNIDKTVYVLVTFSIDEEGRPINLEATDTNATRKKDVRLFKNAAKRGVSKFIFSPKTENGNPVISNDHSLKVEFR